MRHHDTTLHLTVKMNRLKMSHHAMAPKTETGADYFIDTPLIKYTDEIEEKLFHTWCVLDPVWKLIGLLVAVIIP